MRREIDWRLLLSRIWMTTQQRYQKNPPYRKKRIPDWSVVLKEIWFSNPNPPSLMVGVQVWPRSTVLGISSSEKRSVRSIIKYHWFSKYHMSFQSPTSTPSNQNRLSKQTQSLLVPACLKDVKKNTDSLNP